VSLAPLGLIFLQLTVVRKVSYGKGL
jgi:hypothetical protein